MNSHSPAGQSREVEHVTSRVKTTKREIEQLKNDLEKLITLGAKPPVDRDRKPTEVQKIANGRHLEVPSLERPVKKPVPVTHKKTEPAKTSPPKKTRNYNVDEAREFIKKQREKRAEQLKAQIHVADNRVDLKKQKLKELHRKTIELVTKNVQLNRERSKSRDNGPPVRLDKSNLHKKVPQPVARPHVPSKSRERKPPTSTITRATSENRLQQNAKIPEKNKSQSNIKAQVTERASRPRTRSKLTATSVPSVQPQTLDPNFLCPPDKVRPKTENIELEKTYLPEFDQSLAHNAGPIDLNKRIPEAEAASGDHMPVSEKRLKPKRPRKLLEVPITTSTHDKDSKETQTSRVNDFEGVAWMQPPPALPYPYNFINTVKRKLQHAISSPSCADVGVQKWDNSDQTPRVERANSRQEIKEMLIRSAHSELRSFASHKRPNLDLKAVENLELVPNRSDVNGKVETNQGSMSKNLFTNYDSESDTSKNIPDISSESIGSGNSQPRLSLDKLRDLKLQNLGKSASETNGYPEKEPDGYSSDFQKETISTSTKSGGKSESSTIRTIVSDKKIPDLVIPSDTSLKDDSTNYSASGRMKPEDDISEHQELQTFTSFINTSLRPDKSRPVFKSLLTESQISKTQSSLRDDNGIFTDYSASGRIQRAKKPAEDDISEQQELQSFRNYSATSSRGDSSHPVFKSLLTESQISREVSSLKPAVEYLVLKEPSVALAVRRDEDVDAGKIVSTITIRPASETSGIERKDSEGTLNSAKDGASKGSADSISENLEGSMGSKDGSNGSGGKTVPTGSLMSLKEPTLSLVVGKDKRRDAVVRSQMKNITLRSSSSPNANVNEIHLKFEAEVRLLNDFNESFKQFMAAEKAFENLKTRNETNLAMTKLAQNVDTQTSFVTKTSTEKSIKESRRSNSSLINFSRGSDVVEDLEDSVMNANRNNAFESLQNSTLSSEWNLSNLNESSHNTIVSTGEEGRSRFSISSIENYSVNNNLTTNNCLLSLNLFDQLIKDEDTRILQLKAIIKIREQALLDRTKSELLWLDIQKKQLLETGKIEEASLLKKKQRGIILKREQERNEIKKLKQMQKKVSEHRKSTLQQQRNLIKTQLSTDNMLSKITVKKREERRSMGPLRVVQSCSESIHSEASISLKSSGIEDILNITAKSVRASEESEADVFRRSKDKDAVPVSDAKRTLLMREAALQKRRKAAEELLRWHRKLLEEERKISELEAAATSVVKPPPEAPRKYNFNGKQLNQLWRNMTGCDQKKFAEDEPYVMSQIALERLCKSARQYSNKNKKPSTRHSDSSARKSSDDVNYSSVFEPESVQEIINSQEEKTKISSISELIDNFSRIEDEISILGKKSEHIVEDQSSQIMTPTHVEEVPTAETEESEKTAPEVTIEEEPSILEESTEPITEKSESTDEDFQGPKSDDSDQVKSIPEVSFSPRLAETPKEAKSVSEESVPLESPTIEDSEKINSGEVESVPEVSVPLDTLGQSESRKEDLNEEHSEGPIESQKEDSEEVVTAEEQTSLDAEHSRFSAVAEVLEASSEDASAKLEGLEEVSDGSLDVSSSGSEDLLREKSIPTVKDVEDASEEMSDQVLEKSATVTTVEDRDRTETDEESLSRHVDVGKELLALDEALESASKIEESLSRLNEKLASEVSEDVSSAKEVESIAEESLSATSTSKSGTSDTEEKTPQKKTNQIDVKKRVSEILADVSPSRGDKSPRLQDLYVTAYDVGAANPPEANESGEDGRQLPTDIFGTEAEELWRKQLAIEQEIKQIELQQKEQVPFVFMREIPNKPPPPYTPPSSLSSLPQSILPTDVKELSEVASYSSKVLYKAYQTSNLDKVKFSEQGFKLFSKVEVAKCCAEYVFNVCRDAAKEHYRQFERVEEPSWLALPKRPQLTRTEPSDAAGLERILSQKLKELFGFKRVHVAESAIIKWGRKKRDHVDEVLVKESQEEESQWINFEKDELIVKNQVTEEIMKMLLEEAGSVFANILAKKRVAAGCDRSE